MSAAQNGHFDVVDRLLQCKEIDSNLTDAKVFNHGNYLKKLFGSV